MRLHVILPVVEIANTSRWAVVIIMVVVMIVRIHIHVVMISIIVDSHLLFSAGSDNTGTSA